MNKNRTLKKKEIVEFTAKLLNLFRHLVSDYQSASNFTEYNCSVGDWAIETSMIGNTTIESILRITQIDDSTGYYKGIDLLGEERRWNNAHFSKLSQHCQDYLNNKYRW